ISEAPKRAGQGAEKGSDARRRPSGRLRRMPHTPQGGPRAPTKQMGPYRRPRKLAAPAPPVVHEVINHFPELPDRAALADEIARRRIQRHHAIADPPAPLPFRIEPDDPLDALADEPQRPGLGIVVVVARVAQHQDRRLAVEGVEL